MRAVTELPELKPKIESGALTVSAVAKVQTYLRHEKKMGVRREPTAKLALFKTVENCSSREIEAKLAEEKGEKIRPKLILELDEELEALWEKVKNLSAHRTQGSPEEILRLLAREWLKRNDPTREVRSEKNVPVSQVNQETARRESAPKRIPIPAQLKREVWRRDQSRCANCHSGFALQSDHRTPVAQGGRNTLGNLRLLCRSCNLRAGIREFGLNRMKRGTRSKSISSLKGSSKTTSVMFNEKSVSFTSSDP